MIAIILKEPIGVDDNTGIDITNERFWRDIIQLFCSLQKTGVGIWDMIEKLLEIWIILSINQFNYFVHVEENGWSW